VTGWDDQSVWFNALPPYMNQTPYAQMVINWATGGGPPPPYAGGGASIWICPSSLGPAPLLQGAPNDLVFAGNSPFPSQSEPHYWTLYGTASTANLSANGKIKTNVFPFFSSYLINSKLGKTVDVHGNTTTRTRINISQLSPSSEVVTMVESLAFAYEDTDAVVQQWVSGVPTWVQTNTKVDQYGYTSNVSQSGADWTRLTCRHNHGGHILFADGHVSHYGWPEVQITQDQIARGPNLADWNQYGKVVWSPFGPVQ
jgi:prepilin-type processing-associated H-X9-DG protein